MMLNAYKSIVPIWGKIAYLVLFLGLNSTKIAFSDQITVPNYFDAKERLPVADVSSINRIWFLTTVDFPPFNFLDQTGRLSGFHVDLAREICVQLDILDRCQIQALEWKELNTALEEQRGDAIITGISISDAARAKYSFTRTYMELPARFATHNGSSISLSDLKNSSKLKVGVLKGTAHEAMLKSWYPALTSTSMDDSKALFEALKAKEIDVLFGDGLQMSFWLSGQESQNCCKFLGGAHLSLDFLGEGLSIAVSKGDQSLINALNYGLSLMTKNGRFEELYLKYFPKGIYGN